MSSAAKSITIDGFGENSTTVTLGNISILAESLGSPPILSKSGGSIFAVNGYPTAPILTNNNGIITAEAT